MIKLGKGRRNRSQAKTNKKLMLIAGGFIIVAIVFSSVFQQSTNSSDDYVSLGVWEYNGIAEINDACLPLMVDLSRLPDWPTVKYNATTLMYEIDPQESITFTLRFNITVRQNRPLMIDYCIAQRIFVSGVPTMGYIQTNVSANNVMDIGNHLLERKITLTVFDLEQKINWGVEDVVFCVGFVKGVDSSFKSWDFDIGVEYKI